jgi:hypothetical protein
MVKLFNTPTGVGSIFIYVQCSLDLPFFKGVEKTIDKCGETRNPENYFFLTKKVVHCLLLLGRILPQLKI